VKSEFFFKQFYHVKFDSRFYMFIFVFYRLVRVLQNTQKTSYDVDISLIFYEIVFENLFVEECELKFISYEIVGLQSQIIKNSGLLLT